MAALRIDDRGSPVVQRAVSRFIAFTLLALVTVAAGSALVADHLSRELTVRDAVRRGHTFAHDVAAPLVTGRLLRGDPLSLEFFDTVMSNRLKDAELTHINIWRADGSVLWSDDSRLVGRKSPSMAKSGLLRDTRGVGQLIDPRSAPDLLDKTGEKVLEVYTGVRSADGDPMVVETFWSSDGLEERQHAIFGAILRLTLSGLLIFALPILLLSLTLARRIERGERNIAKLLRTSAAAADLERRRIAADLHDGVLQEASGAAYALRAVSRTIPTRPQEAVQLTEMTAEAVGRMARLLRNTVSEIYPGDLRRESLRDLVEELVQRARGHGFEVTWEVDPLAEEKLEARQLVYRIVREGLRNVQQHSDGTHCSVLVASRGDSIVVEVVDDGKGPGSAVSPEGHFGLRLLQDSVTAVGGQFRVERDQGGGTRLSVEFPRDLVPDSPQGLRMEGAAVLRRTSGAFGRRVT